MGQVQEDQGKREDKKERERSRSLATLFVEPRLYTAL